MQTLCLPHTQYLITHNSLTTGVYMDADIRYLRTQFSIIAGIRGDLQREALLIQIDPMLMNISVGPATVGGYGDPDNFPTYAYPQQSYPGFAYPDQPESYSYYPDAPPVPPPPLPPVAGPVPGIAMHSPTCTYFCLHMIVLHTEQSKAVVTLDNIMYTYMWKLMSL